MLCEKPFISPAGAAYGCGQCMACRFNRVRLWQHRILLEAKLHGDNAFVTLTYSDEELPEDGSLDPREAQRWLKKLRKRIEPLKIRYFLCGEYSDSWRPHYHAILFGFPSCAHGQSRYSKIQRRCCNQCELVRDTWGHGHIQVGTVEAGSAGYVCGYVTKRMTRYDDPRLDGRHPEFARMSLRPGLGRDAMFEVADTLLKHPTFAERDVPSALDHTRVGMPLGRYLRGSLRKFVGRSEKAPQATLDEMAAKMLPLRLAAIGDSADPSLKSKVVKANAQKRRSLYARRKIFTKGRGL